MKVGDLVRFRGSVGVKNQLGIVVEQGYSTVRIHFHIPEKGRTNPRWVSTEFLEVLNESR